MAHSISAFVGKRPALAALSAVLGQAPIYRLGHAEFLVLPVSDDAFDALVAAQGPSELAAHEFWRLTDGLAELARTCSEHGAVAYIETDYFGGAGVQGAAAWIGGRVVLSPTADEKGPINVALRAIGLTPTGTRDEFDTLGLGDVRRMDAFEEMQPA